MAHISAEALARVGFTDEVEDRSAFAVLNVAGMEGTGKTHFALSAPKPLLYQGTDHGGDGVLQQFKKSGQIIRPSKNDYKLDIPLELRDFADKEEKPAARQARERQLAKFVHEQFYVPFFKDFLTGVELGVRSIVWDNALDVWEYTRLSVYGRRATNRSDLTAEANSKYREMVRLANVHKINLIMINHLKPEWESYQKGDEIKWKKSGGWEMQGFDKCPFLITANVWLFMHPEKEKLEDRFTFQIKKCRDNHQWVGQTLPACSFVDLMGVLVPGVENWG
jgi:hypothetical protein